MTTASWDREKAYAECEELLKRATTPEESDKIATANQLNSPLLRLPGEIRNHIYTYACRSTTVKHGKRPEVSERSCLFTQTFLLTCKQIYCEAIALLYTYATFELSGFGGWAAHVSLNPKYRNLITSLHIDTSVLYDAIKITSAARRGVITESHLPEEYLPGVQRVHVRNPARPNHSVRNLLKALLGKEDLRLTGDP